MIPPRDIRDGRLYRNAEWECEEIGRREKKT